MLFVRKLVPPQVELHGTTVQINASLAARVTKELRTRHSRRIGAALRECDGEAATDAFAALVADLDDVAVVIDATAAELEATSAARKALETGELPGGAPDLALAAADAFALAAMIRQAQPDAKLATEDVAETLDALSKAETALGECLELAQDRYAKTLPLRQRAAKAAHALGDLDRLRELQAERYLPPEWRQELADDTDLQPRLQRRLDAEHAATKARRSESREALDRAELQTELAEIHHG